MLLAFSLRIYRLDQQSIWYDEGLSIYYARQNIPRLLEGTSATDHPPLYFVLLHGWLRLVGDTEFAVRYLSLAWSLLLVPVAYVLGRRLLGWRTGVLAIALLALSPFHIWYAQEVRMYTLAAFLNTLASLVLLSALLNGQRRDWLAYVTLSVAGLYAHFYSVFVLAFQGAFAAWLSWRQQRWKLLAATAGAQMAAAVAFLPWGRFAVEQIQTNDTYWRGTLALGRALAWLLRAFAIGETYAGTWTTVSAATCGLLALAGGVMAARRASSVGRRSGQESGLTSAYAHGALPSLVFLALYIVIPIACLLALSYNRPKFAPRYLLAVTPAYYLLAGYGLRTLLGGGLVRLGQRPHRVLIPAVLRTSGAVCLGIALVASALALRLYYGAPEYAKPDFRAVGRYIARHAEDDDGVVVVAGYALPAFVYYNHRDLDLYPVPARLLPTVTHPVDRRLVTETLNRAVGDGHLRLWLVLWQEEMADPVRLTLLSLERYGHRLGVLEAFHDVSLLLFDIPPGTQFLVQPPISHPLGVSFDGQLELLGYDLGEGPVRPSETFWLTLYWRAMRPLTENYTAFTHLLGPGDRMLGQKDGQLGGTFYPSSRWPVGEVFEEIYPIVVRDDAPPGRYPLWTGLYLRRTMERLPVTLADGRQETRLLVAEIEIGQ